MWKHFRITQPFDIDQILAETNSLPRLTEIDQLPGNLKGFGGEFPLGRARAAKVLRRQSDPYSTIEVPKRNGSVRHISAPHTDMKKFQTILLKKLLTNEQVAHPCAYAYVRGKSATQCARAHSEANWAIKLDLRDFFESIDEKQVFWAFRSRGVSNFKSFFLARFTTRLERQPSEVKKSLRGRYSGKGTPQLRKYQIVQRHKLLKKFEVQRRRVGYVPQGSPTSGQVSNLVFYPVDVRLNALAKESGFTYTRYADDIVISSKNNYSRGIAEGLLSRAARIVQEAGFTVNSNKTRILKPGSRMLILGVLIGKPGLRIPAEKKKHLDQTLRSISKFGFEAHANYLELDRSYRLLNQVHGFLVWAYDVEPTWAAPRLKQLKLLASEQLLQNEGFAGF